MYYYYYYYSGPQQEHWFQGGLHPHSSLHNVPPVSLRKTRHLLHEGVLRSEASLPPLHNENWHRLDFNYAGALFISTAVHFSRVQEKHFVLDAFHFKSELFRAHLWWQLAIHRGDNSTLELTAEADLLY